MQANKIPEQDYLCECFLYNQATGELIWKKRPLTHFKNSHGMNTFNSKFAGIICNAKQNNGYYTVLIKRKQYLVHRVIWKHMTGQEPAHIDHKDGDKRNNKWKNLRAASKQQNAFNVGKTKRNKTGYKGVSFDKSRSKYYASIRKDGKTVSLGRHDTAKQASIAYQNAARKLHKNYYTE